jgi:hypothetical protein
MRRAFVDLLHGVNWVGLALAGVGTLAGTFVLTVLDPPSSVASVAFGAMGATIACVLLAPVARPADRGVGETTDAPRSGQAASAPERGADGFGSTGR